MAPFHQRKLQNSSRCPHPIFALVFPHPWIPAPVATSFSHYAAPTFSLGLFSVLPLTFKKSWYPCRDLERQIPSQPAARQIPPLLFCPGGRTIPGDSPNRTSHGRQLPQIPAELRTAKPQASEDVGHPYVTTLQ